MTTAANVVAVAKGQVGYHERGNNWTKYWAELAPGFQGAPWCAVFASWVYIHAGHRLPNMGAGFGYINAGSAMRWAKAHGYWSSGGRYSPADLIIFGGGEHTGICVADNGSVVTTIDGNWGDMVQPVRRSHGIYVTGAVKASRMLSGTPIKPPPPPPVKHRNVAQVKALQVAVHVGQDGILGNITTHAINVVLARNLSSVKYIQARVGAVQDGHWGPYSEAARIATIKRIQRAIFATPDGSWGPQSKARWAVAYANNKP